MVSKLSGVGVHTIRAWEKRYDAVVPKRSATGRREYCDVDLEKLVLLNQLCTLGHSIGKIAPLDIAELKELLEKLGKVNSEDLAPEKISGELNLNQSLDNMVMAITLYKLDVIDHELSKLKLLVNTRDLVIKVLIPLLNKVGALIQRRELSPAGELAFHGLLKFHLGEVIYKSRRKNPGLSKVIVAGGEGSIEEIPLLLVSILLISKNIEVIYLGNDVSAGALVETINATEAKGVMLYLGPLREERESLYHQKYMEYLTKKVSNDVHFFALKSNRVKDLEGPVKNFSIFESIKHIDQSISF
ncbi:MerR family transcriptional regulator [Bacteriovorax sp. Seq25_V]|uniref:MerR family transcriptional regulator n=1 Tax=Bacteriovorax sp. Seq25_V TaxID=1201288 RepID=UPI000550CA27|nr:MerR family transcriptional regulator [Bacteriovorax sp. Seq25_V]